MSYSAFDCEGDSGDTVDKQSFTYSLVKHMQSFEESVREAVCTQHSGAYTRVPIDKTQVIGRRK